MPEAPQPSSAPPKSALPYADISTPRPEFIGAGAGITRGDVAALLVKLLGVYFVVQGLAGLAFAVEAVFGGFRAAFSGYYYLSALALYVGAGLALLLRGDRIGAWLLPKNQATIDLSPSPGSSAELQSAAFAVAGILLAVWAASTAAFWFAQYLRQQVSAGGLMPHLIQPAIELALGVWLFFGSKRLTLYWQRMRGTAPPRNPDEGPL